MSLFTDPIPFVEAIKHLFQKKVMPTNLGSADLKQLSAGVRNQSLFSAQTTLTDYLDEVKKSVESIVNPQQVQREGEAQTVTVGYNPAKAQEVLKKTIEKLGYQPDPEKRGTIEDLSSDKRIKLVIDTNVQLAQGAGAFVQQNSDPELVDLWPALELYRLEDKKQPRDWEQRWHIAAQVAGDPKAAAALGLHGRMVALKSSGIWQALGDGAGGYDDTLGNPFAPFAFQSGMWTQDVSRDDAVSLGLIAENEEAKPADYDLGSLLGQKEAA